MHTLSECCFTNLHLKSLWTSTCSNYCCSSLIGWSLKFASCSTHLDNKMWKNGPKPKFVSFIVTTSHNMLVLSYSNDSNVTDCDCNPAPKYQRHSEPWSGMKSHQTPFINPFLRDVLKSDTLRKGRDSILETYSLQKGQPKKLAYWTWKQCFRDMEELVSHDLAY